MGIINLPLEYLKYQNINAYFITYYGDVYFGKICRILDFPDRIFIVSPNNIRKWTESIKNKNISLIELQNLGHEIRDIDIIKKVINDEDLSQNDENLGNFTIHGKQNWKKIILFGAGASSYCIYNDEIKDFRKEVFSPPLGNELFDKKFRHLLENYPGAKLSIPSIKLANNDVELYYESEWELIRNKYVPEIIARHINIQFYLHELFSNVSKFVLDNYFDSNLFSVFTDKIQKYLLQNEHEKAAIVSFNYDTILDTCLSDFFQLDLKTTDDYVDFNNKPIMLFKPHGSCNWGWKVNNSMGFESNKPLSQSIYNHNITYDKIYYELIGYINDMIQTKSWGYEWALSQLKKGKYSVNLDKIEVINSSNDSFFPALLIPYRDKDQFVMPFKHYYIMKSFVERCEELHLIGWKGSEASFNNLLMRNSNLKKLIVANPESNIVIENLPDQILSEKVEIIKYKSFEEYVREHKY